jgi:hypothetical protein
VVAAISALIVEHYSTNLPLVYTSFGVLALLCFQSHSGCLWVSDVTNSLDTIIAIWEINPIELAQWGSSIVIENFQTLVFQQASHLLKQKSRRLLEVALRSLPEAGGALAENIHRVLQSI